MNTERHQIVVNGLPVQIVRKAIKNLHLGVYPPNGRVRVAVPLAVSDHAVRLAVVGKLGWIKRQRASRGGCTDSFVVIRYESYWRSWPPRFFP